MNSVYETLLKKIWLFVFKLQLLQATWSIVHDHGLFGYQ